MINSSKICVILMIVLVSFSTVFAANQVVTSNADSGAGSLRQAIVNVGEGEEITFNIASNDIITISSELSISKSLTINGYNNETGNNVTVQVTTPGISTWRVFNINASGKTIDISNMTIKGGDISSLLSTNSVGGGIYISDPSYTGTTVNLDYITVSDSKALSGGGINVSFNCVLNMDHSTIKNNTAYTSESSSTYAFVYGGGIFAITSEVNINNSTISGNTAYAINTNSSGYAYAYGGGLYFAAGADEAVRTFFINNSTVFGNIANSVSETGLANSLGAGIYAEEDGVIINCTITNNDLIANGVSSTRNGSGVVWYQGNAEITNSIIANNENNTAEYDFCNYYANLTDNGYNVIEYSNIGASESNGFNNVNDILYNTKHGESGLDFTSWTKSGTVLDNQNLNLASVLADNGGPTETLAVEPGSFAIGAGLYNASYSTDQRGESRNDPPTIGAYEAGLFVWCGAVNTDWNTIGNWVDDEVPNATNSIEIPADCSNYPVIDEDVVCKNITIKDGGALQINSSYSLDIYGDFILQDGGIFANNGTLFFSGSSCNLTDNRIAKTSLGNVTIEDITDGNILMNKRR